MRETIYYYSLEVEPREDQPTNHDDHNTDWSGKDEPTAIIHWVPIVVVPVWSNAVVA